MDQPALTQMRFSLSSRLLIFTIVFVLLAEAFIFVPSIARFRQTYLLDHMRSAHLAALALEAAPDNMVDQALEDKLLGHAKAYGVILQDTDKRMLVLSKDMPPTTDARIDMGQSHWFSLVMGAAETLGQKENRVLRVIGDSPRMPGTHLEVIIDEAPLQQAMLDYAGRILALSLVISLITALLVFFSLKWMFVRPIRRIVQNMAQFRNDPENDATIMVPSGRRDELGMAENELTALQRELRQLLNQKDRLAAIGAAVAKINHDLRNALSKAMLVSDQIAQSSDEKTSLLAPQLSTTVDQAIDMCGQTLEYVANSNPRLDKELFYLEDLVLEVREHIEDLLPNDTAFTHHIDGLTEAEGDVIQLRRVMVNLCRNAFQMGAQQVELSSKLDLEGRLLIDIKDNGPGLPDKAKENLFKPFVASTRRGGTGLGLVIARDILRAHNGNLELIRTGANGTCFRLILPKLI